MLELANSFASNLIAKNGNLEALIGVGYTGLIGTTIGALSLLTSKTIKEREFDSHYKRLDEYKNNLVYNFRK